MEGLENLEGVFAVLGVFVIFIIIIAIVWLVFYIIGMWKLFQKAGKQGWEAIIPFYNNWVLVEISGLAWWWFLIVSASWIVSFLDIDGLSSIAWLASIFGNFCCYYNISKKLHKDTGFAILTTIFSFIMIPVIGLSNNYQFDNSVEVSDMGPFANQSSNDSHTHVKNDDNNFDKAKKFCSHCGSPVDEESKFCQNCGTKLK